MIKIYVQTTSDEGRQMIGVFNPSETQHVIDLLCKHGVYDMEGERGKVNEVKYDVGFEPSIWVRINYA